LVDIDVFVSMCPPLITTVEKTRTKRTEETDEALHWRSRCVSVRPKR
jgi:hypothetical protein